MTSLFKCLTIKKRFIAVMAMDAILLSISLWAAFALRFSTWWPQEMQNTAWLFILAPLIAFPIFVRSGLYRAILNYISTKAFTAITNAVSLQAILLLGVSVLFGINGLPITLFAIYWLVSLTLVGGSRAILRALFEWLIRVKHPATNIIVYGAGSAGAELAESLQAGLEFDPVAFVDDKHKLHGTEIRGLTVFPTAELDELIRKYHAKQILLAIPSAPLARRQELISFLEAFPIHVKTIPTLRDIVSGRSRIADLRDIDIEDILGRNSVAPDIHLLSSCIKDKSVLVTGAGGSIGSELARQIVHLKPSHLILFDACEFALYTIERELAEYCKHHSEVPKDIQIVPVLGSVGDEYKLNLMLKTYSVQTVYHAAAYKHVPLVEYNPIEGVRNNVFGTLYTARAALVSGVETFIFISTDKAVRPTNVMGATKRVAELVIQGMARKSSTTKFSIVRFGNVLNSSGSVVPLFRQQIKDGGPITLTHPDITRYFMTIPEAAQLVIQAGSMAKKGVVFVLDMGKPVRIKELAIRMVSLSGLSVRDKNNPRGDIEIRMTNLRPGEKIYEELLLGDNVTKTRHPRIMQAQEVELPWVEVAHILNQLDKACASYDSAALLIILQNTVDGYIPQSGIKDCLWLAAHKPTMPHKIQQTVQKDMQQKMNTNDAVPDQPVITEHRKSKVARPKTLDAQPIHPKAIATQTEVRVDSIPN